MVSRYSFIAVSCLLLFGLPLFGCSSENQEAKYRSLVEKATQYEKDNKLEEARITWLNAVELKPEEADGYFHLADIFILQKRYGDAIQHFNNVINLNPNHREARLRLAAMMLAGKQYEQAENHIRKLLEADPKDVDGLVLSANLKSVRKEYAEARSILESLLAAHPNHPMVLANLADLAVSERKLPEAEDYLQRALKVSPDNGPMRVALADVYTAQGRFDDAQEILEAVVKTTPQNTGLRFYFSEFLLSRGSAEKATEQYLAILKADPLEHAARDRLYDFYMMQGDADAAKKLALDLKGVVEENDAALQFFLGRNAELEGKKEEALVLYLKALEGLPQFGPAFRNAGLVEVALGKKSEGIEHLNQAVNINSYDVGARLALARHFFVKRDVAQASAQVKKVLERYPRQIGANVLYADILMLQGDFETAKKVYQALVENFPDGPLGYVKQAMLAERQNKRDEAIELYRKALSFDRDVMVPAGRFVQLIFNRDGFEKTVQELDTLRQASKQAGAHYRYLTAQLLSNRKESTPEDLNKARQLYQEILLDKPEYLLAYVGLAELDSRDRDYPAAAKNYEHIIAEKPEHVPSRMLLALNYERQTRYPDAAEQYRAILKTAPRFGPAANNLAWLLTENLKGNLDEALDLALIAKETLPHEAGVADTLAWVYHRRGSSRAALPLLEEAVELEKKGKNDRQPNPEILYHLGVVKMNVGDADGAKEALNQAMSVAGESYLRKSEIQDLLKQLG